MGHPWSEKMLPGLLLSYSLLAVMEKVSDTLWMISWWACGCYFQKVLFNGWPGILDLDRDHSVLVAKMAQLESTGGGHSSVWKQD